MIKGYCFTNLDGYDREEWPKEFVAVPLQGDWVGAKSGRILRVVKITHYMTKDWTNSRYEGLREEIIVLAIKVELSKT